MTQNGGDCREKTSAVLHPTKDTHVAIILVVAYNLRIQSRCCVSYVKVSTHIGAVAYLAVGSGVGPKCGEADLNAPCCKSVT